MQYLKNFQISENQHPTIVIGALLIGLYLTMGNTARRALFADFQNKTFLLILSGIIIFTYFVFRTPANTDKEKRFKEAIRKGLSGLLIAYLSRLDMFFSHFFTIFALDYFLSGWT